jgi:hypothetical protein
MTLPIFWAGILLMYFFGLKLGWLPIFGYTSPFQNFWLSTKQIILPVFCLSIGVVAGDIRLMRSSMLDVLGTEVNWLQQGEYAPDADAVMLFRRALCRQKPYCLLLNTDYAKFTPALVERYFQRCLFYGVWPGFFDPDAASKDPYWTSSKRWYERDRALFKKYIPLFQRVTAAGAGRVA